MHLTLNPLTEQGGVVWSKTHKIRVACGIQAVFRESQLLLYTTTGYSKGK